MSGSDLSSRSRPKDHLMEALDIDANVDMARLLNDAFVMVYQMVGGAQQNSLLNDEPIILDHPNVGGHAE